MLVSTKGRYALRVMLELAQDDSAAYLPLPAIAERQGISEKYLESIISVLVKAGLVEGVRGKGGGYRLCRAQASLHGSCTEPVPTASTASQRSKYASTARTSSIVATRSVS